MGDTNKCVFIMEFANTERPRPVVLTRRANIAAAATTTISELPDDVIFDILVRMPDIKSVIRCERVCKKWRNLILQPCFAKSQSSRGSLPPSLIFYSPPNIFPARFGILELDDDLARLGRQNATVTFRSEIYMPREGCERRVIGACNGLVCLHVGNDIVVCNPILQGRLPFVLPKLANSWSSFGFGFSPLSDEYKVLRCNETYEDGIISIDVCTLGKDDTWRNIGGGHTGKPFPCCYTSPGADFVFLNGALYFRGSDSDMDSIFLCYFDVGNEELGNLSLPCHINDTSIMLRLGVLDNLLYLSEGLWLNHVNVWVMRDYIPPGAWTLKWVVKDVPYSFELDGQIRPIKVLKDRTVLMISSNNKVLAHNPQTGLTEIIKYHEVLFWTKSISHTPSFLCPTWLL